MRRGGPGGRAGAGLPRAVSYLRVSTGGQVDSTSIDTQREQCQALARAHGLVLVGEYLDAGVSGAAASRPGLEELLAAATAGEVEVVLVAKLDRLGRSLLHLLGLIEHLNALGLRVISASDMIDTKTPAGRMMLGLLGAFAEFERERLTERSVDGAYRRVLAGGFVGSIPPFGYRPVPDPTGAVGVVLDIDPTQAACIRAMYRLLVRDRVPLTRAITDLNCVGHRSASGKPWTKNTLSRWVRGDGPTTAAGAWRWRDLRVPIPPILTAAEHAAWMAWKRDTARPAHRHSAYLLGGRVRTPCGRYFHGRTAGRDNPVYVCRHRKKTPADDPDRCACRSIRVQTLDDAVWSQVRTALTTPPPPVTKRPPGSTDARPAATAAASGGSGSRLDIGADTLVPRIADAAERRLPAATHHRHRIPSGSRRRVRCHHRAAHGRTPTHRTGRRSASPDPPAGHPGNARPCQRTPPSPTARHCTGPAPGSTSSTCTANNRSSTYSTYRHRSPATTNARPAPEPATNPSHPAQTGTRPQAARPATACASCPRSPSTSAHPSCSFPTPPQSPARAQHRSRALRQQDDRPSPGRSAHRRARRAHRPGRCEVHHGSRRHLAPRTTAAEAADELFATPQGKREARAPRSSGRVSGSLPRRYCSGHPQV